ncbi:transient receptor potential cation channel subfamily A member 1-like isoform X2 [Mercenaria mercenaria]|uniref:transient receptor potential cation channel subfamily A member 1-like isoform X2 n=1 Tax=Mercenaria mercenaria TaxID=6596 RepID=UPI00234F0BB5|nr:transient receptor potential cation channel subfamily A member 1-like isoform X2 [Mercenaria mercenaria]
MPEATEPMLGNTNGETIEMQPIEPSRTDESHAGDSNCILDCLKRKKVDIKQLKEMVKLPDADLNFNNNKDKKTALHWAAEKGHRIAVSVLLEAGAYIKRDIEGNTALHYAVQRQSFAVFKLLLPPRETLETRYGQELQYSTAKGNTQTKSDCYIDIATSVNVEGFNVLDLALEDLKDERKKIVRYLVRETDLDCLQRLLRNNSKGNFSSPFRGLIKKMPDIGTCVEYTNSIKKMKNNHPLKLMINNRIEEKTRDGIYQQLLDHPLVKALVRRKWNHIGVKFHILNLVWYLIYLAVLTLCVSTTVPPYVHSLRPISPFTYRNTTACQVVTSCEEETTCKSGNTCKNTTICQNTTTCLNKTTAECHSLESNHKPMIVYMQYFVIVLSIIMIIKEVYQMVRMYGREYFKQIENYVELAVYISSVLFVVNVTDCENTDYRTNLQWVSGTFSVFMAWINLLTFAKKFDRLGIYVMMLWSIIKTLLLNLFPFVAALLMAFALAFTCVHQSQEQFANVGHSLLTTTYLMINGFDYEEFLRLVENHDTAFVSYIIYSLFQIIMAIAIINLTVGVAVENVQEIRKYASDVNTVLQIEYTLEFEGMVCFIISKLRNSKLRHHFDFKKFNKWFILKEETIQPHQLNSIRIPMQQITDLIDRNKAKDERDGLEMKMTKKMNKIKKQLIEMNSTLKTKLTELNSTITGTNKRMNTFGTRLIELNSTITGTKKRMNTLETKMTGLYNKR